MADVIKLLPDHVANQIAAGEVVQRPSSVIKELLENAVDAKANNIKLIVKDAGKTLIQVIDDGVGMSVTDARLSFERHATSKIQSAEDLFNLHTKGFRGEALASIAAVAHVELKTKPANVEVGTAILIEGSEVVSQEVSATPTGTSVAVKNLFYNIPARRNFLKSNTVEFRHVVDEFHRVAMAHPNIGFKLFHNGSELFNLPESNFRQRIVNIFGAKTNEKLVPVKEQTEIVSINGFVGKPEFAKKTRGEQYFFVNNRFVKSGYLNHAVNAAFEGLIKDNQHPSFFIFLEVDPDSIDINIHPTKTEIKFDDEQSLYAILRSTIKHSLGQFNIAPILDFERDNNLDVPYNFKQQSASSPTIEVNSSFNPFAEKDVKTGFVSKSFNKEKSTDWESLYVGLKDDIDGNHSSHIQFESSIDAPELFESQSNRTTYQVFNKYIISTMKSGMLVVNQSRAHQRILYEEFLSQITLKEPSSQQLLFPVKLNLNSKEKELLESIEDNLNHAGFKFNFEDDKVLEISSIPLGLDSKDIGNVFETVLSDVEHEVPESNFSSSDLLAKSMAKTLAIRSGKPLSALEQEQIINSLFACKEPNVSPENKLTFITLSSNDLDKKFN